MVPFCKRSFITVASRVKRLKRRHSPDEYCRLKRLRTWMVFHLRSTELTPFLSYVDCPTSYSSDFLWGPSAYLFLYLCLAENHLLDRGTGHRKKFMLDIIIFIIVLVDFFFSSPLVSSKVYDTSGLSCCLFKKQDERFVWTRTQNNRCKNVSFVYH